MTEMKPLAMVALPVANAITGDPDCPWRVRASIRKHGRSLKLISGSEAIAPSSKRRKSRQPLFQTETDYVDKIRDHGLKLVCWLDRQFVWD